jgi:hypothetical protein
MFRKLMLDGRKHFQNDLAAELNCSPQTVIRLAGEIESVVGISLEMGLEHRKRWYRIRTITRSRLAMDFEEIRYLTICRDLAGSLLPEEVRNRVDDSIFNLSLLMGDQEYADRENVQQRQVSFFRKGYIEVGWKKWTP